MSSSEENLSAGTKQGKEKFTTQGPRIVTTTGILANFAREVAGNRASVSQIVPDGADPHSYEPTLRSIRDIAYADIAFSNYMLLEQHAIIRTLDANLQADAVQISVAEESAKNGATILPLVEDRSLDTAWLGMRVSGQGNKFGANRSSTIDLYVTEVSGPGTAAGYITTSFGEPEVAFSSHDGFQAQSGFAEDTATLPAAAHQHMSWAFTKPGIYEIDFSARLRVDESSQPINLESATAVFAVGVEASSVLELKDREVISSGHADIAVDLETGDVALAREQKNKSGKYSTEMTPLSEVVIEVPTRTLTQVPGTRGYRFMGKGGTDVYVLPQAVLGKHVHGAIDPHLWHNVQNAAAYVQVIRDQLSLIDPIGAPVYAKNAARYLQKLAKLDLEVAEIIAHIPEAKRKLVTTSDAFGYLAAAYNLEVAGFVAPNPAVEPSVADRIKLSATIRDLKIDAVFLEPNLLNRRSTLRTVAEDAGVKACPLYGDTFDENAPDYLAMMRFNANSLKKCLGEK
ncbi:MAG: anchored repeat ABC transporter, substrate-binding protein [Arcanobacterium sp.]|nr:anchored repeat ABC transporter, substrate-binding protein [Arcanobacterium sp.]